MDVQIIEIPRQALKLLPERIAKKAHQLFFRYGIRAIRLSAMGCIFA